MVVGWGSGGRNGWRRERGGGGGCGGTWNVEGGVLLRSWFYEDYDNCQVERHQQNIGVGPSQEKMFNLQEAEDIIAGTTSLATCKLNNFSCEGPTPTSSWVVRHETVTSFKACETEPGTKTIFNDRCEA